VRLLQRVRSDLELHGVVEQFPRLEGRQMVMVLSPLKKEQRDKIKREAAKKPAAATEDAAKKPASAKSAVKPVAKPVVKPAVKPEATT